MIVDLNIPVAIEQTLRYSQSYNERMLANRHGKKTPSKQRSDEELPVNYPHHNQQAGTLEYLQ